MLWPSLLEFIAPVEYTEAIRIVSRCISAVAGKKREQNADDYEITFEELGLDCCSIALL